jgi:outer membrane immunogenic protein
MHSEISPFVGQGDWDMTNWMRGTAALALLLGTVVGAQAADRKIPVLKKKPVYKAEPLREAPSLVVPSWAGMYFGVSLGVRWADVTWTTTSIVPPPAGTVPASESYADRSFRAGGYVGYNWQIAPTTIFGVEADFAWADGKRSVGGIPGTYSAAGAALALANDSSTVREGWDSSVRARFGLLISPTWLAYGTGGWAWQNVEASASCVVAGGYCLAPRSESARKTLSGWTVGGGLEGMMSGGWLARVEYRYADYRPASQTFFGGTGDDINFDLKLRTHAALIGFAYRFNLEGVPGVVSARY